MNEKCSDLSLNTYTVGVKLYNNIVDNRVYSDKEYTQYIWDIIKQITNDRQFFLVDEFLYATFIAELTQEELLILKLKLKDPTITQINCSIEEARDQVVNNSISSVTLELV